MRRSDAFTIKTKTSSKELMFRAGNAIYDAVAKERGWSSPAAVVCGSGNNAGDGYVLAARLADEGIDCTIFLTSETFSADGGYFFGEAEKRGVKVLHGTDALVPGRFACVADCVFGTGFHGEVAEPFRTAIRRINESGAYVVSADINSGLGGDSGIADDIAVHSDLTVSIGCFKSGLFLNSAKDFIKKKVNADIGIDPVESPARLIEPSDISHLFVRNINNTNKGDYGYVALIGGSLEYSGAAKLANLSLSALRAGAGVSKLAVPSNLCDAVLPYLLESTLFPLDVQDGKYCFAHSTAERLLFHTRAAAVGMGMGRSGEVKKFLEYALCEYGGRLVVDADGLNVLSEMDTRLFRNASCRLILTPHPKEFERLSGVKFEDFRYDLISAAKAYAKKTGAIVLLKGTTTIVTDGETVYLVDRGCPGMATAGSGDVLSGILAGICGYAPDDELLLGVAAGAYLNGLAGELAQRDIPAAAMLSGDTVAHIPAAMKELLGC